MKRRLCLLWIAFSIDIQVNAGEWLSAPAHCGLGEPGCAWQVKEVKSTWTWQESKISAAARASLVWVSGSEAQLMKGSFLVEMKGESQLRLTTASLTPNGQALIERTGSETRITTLSGHVLIAPMTGASFNLPAGYTVKIGPMGSEGKTILEIPQIAAVDPTAKKWWPLFPGPKAEFLQAAQEFANTVHNNVDAYSESQRRTVLREIASLREEERRLEAIRQRAAREDARLRALYRKMNYMGEEFPD
jgi:hypothetical protein